MRRRNMREENERRREGETRNNDKERKREG